MNESLVPNAALPKHWPSFVRSAVLHVISLAHFALVHTRSFAANSPLERVRLKGELDEARAEIVLLKEELRIKDARLSKIDPRRRPHYPPVERLAILALRAARAWSTAESARHFLIEGPTIAMWMRRIDEQGEDALVRTPEPVNRFPDFVRDIVQRLRAVSPTMGKVRIAQTLARSGMHIAASTVKRMLAQKRAPTPTAPAATDSASSIAKPTRPVTAPAVHHTWQVDLTLAPTRAGFWCPWWPIVASICHSFLDSVRELGSVATSIESRALPALHV